MIEEKDRLLLSHLQKGLPLSNRPFAALGAKTGLDAADVLLRVEKLRREGFLNGIEAVWDGRVFRYQGAWAAMRFNKEEFDQKAKIVGEHPGVIYSAERGHDFNFWFFLAVPAGHDLESHVRVLEKQTAAKAGIFLPLRKVLKGSGLLRSLEGSVYGFVPEHFEEEHSPGVSGLSLDEIRAIRVMQGDLPVTDEPYRQAAEGLGISGEKFLDLLNGLVKKGCLKRIGARLAARRQEINSKTLVVWKIPDEKLMKVAEFFSECREVVYADLRPDYPEFPYSVYTLIKAGDPAQLEVLVRRIEDGIGKWPYKTVRLVRKIKKIPVRYFPKELDAWWVRNRPLVETAYIAD